MTAEQSLRSGDVDTALQELQGLVRAEPAVARHRVFLFQILVVQGQWERARTQLNVLRDMDPATIPMVQTYREALRCEVLRAEVFAGRRSPLLFGEPAQWAAEMVQALTLSAQGKIAESQPLRVRALEAAPATPGSLTVASGKEGGERELACQWIADADTRLGPILEAIVNGKYYWIPWETIREVRLDPPTDLRDVVWMPCTFRWQNGGEAVGLLPARYPGSESAADQALRLGRRTEWADQGSDVFFGLGQKVLTTDEGEFGLLDVRAVALQAAGD